MKLVEKLEEYVNQYMFIRWATGGEYGKLISTGEDFIEFNIIDIETMAYKETGGEYAIDGIAGISFIGGMAKVMIPMMMKRIWINNLVFSGVYAFSCAFVIGSGFIVNHYIYPDNRKNKEETEKRKKEWLVQDKLRELRKE